MKVQRRYSICFTYAKRKPPHGAATPKGGLLFSAYGPRSIRQATCNSDDRRQWRKQGGAVGAAASRMRAAAKQTLGAATRAPLIKLGGVGRRISITYFSAKRYNKTPAVHPHDRRFLFNSYFSCGISFASSARTSSPRCSSFVFG